MQALRVTFAVLALSALPLVAASAQGQSADKCGFAASRASAQAKGLATAPGQVQKCPAPVPVPPPPSSDPPPTGIHSAAGFVYEDVDGNGDQDMTAGELGLADWVVELHWNGQMIASKTVGPDGYFKFDTLGNSTWTVCVNLQASPGSAAYNRTQPATGNACGGNGYEFPLNSSLGTQFRAQFGFMLAQ